MQRQTGRKRNASIHREINNVAVFSAQPIQSDEVLMQRLIELHDRLAFEQLYDRYAGKLIHYCKRMVLSKESAEDIVHEAFVRLIENPGAFDPKQRFSTWMYTIAHHLCLNTIRNQQNRERLTNLYYRTEEEQYMQTGIDAQKIKTSINTLFKQLSEKEQTIFVLRFEHELPVKEIAQITNIPEGSVKSCLFYLLQKFSTHLKPLTH